MGDPLLSGVHGITKDGNFYNLNNYHNDFKHGNVASNHVKPRHNTKNFYSKLNHKELQKTYKNDLKHVRSYEPVKEIRVRNYDKQQFVLAHCQFVVLNNNQLIPNNPDQLVDWNCIQYVIIWSQNDLFCPICLSLPVPARLTKCGHVFCWPCILHYLALGENYWRRCPICYEAVKKSDLKSVIIKNAIKYAQGDKITFILLKCLKMSAQIFPIDPFVQGYNPHNFAKIIKVDRNELIESVILQERELLDELSQDNDNTTEIPYIIEAMESNLASLDAISSMSEAEEDSTIKDDLIAPAESYHYFYQAIDGQPFYLHPINTKMLLETFNNIISNDDINPKADLERLRDVSNSPTFIAKRKPDTQLKLELPDWSKCPPILKDVSVISVESHIITVDFRKRYRFLSHLPLYKEIFFTEVSFFTSTVADKMLKTAKNQLIDQIDSQDLVYINKSVLSKFLPALQFRAKERGRTERQNKLLEQSKARQFNSLSSEYSDTYCNSLINGLNPLDLNSETDFPTAKLQDIKPICANASTSSSWNNDSIPDEHKHLSFAQLIKEISDGGFNPNNNKDWINVSKSKYAPDVPNIYNLKKDLANALSDEDGATDEDPELRPYLWGENKQKLDTHSINLLDILVPSSNKKLDGKNMQDKKKRGHNKKMLDKTNP